MFSCFILVVSVGNKCLVITGSQVQCYARAVTVNGDPGQEKASPVVSIDTGRGVCPGRGKSTSPFSAKLRYTGKLG